MLLNTPNAELGWQAEEFKLADANGKTYTLSELQNGKPLLVAFICNHCPYVIAIIDRLVSDAKTLQSEAINVVAINANDYSRYPDDSPENMLLFADKYGFTFPYLIDQDQSVAKNYGAVCTPDFFGFNINGELQYRGRLDDAKMGDATHRKTELLDAMRQIASTQKSPESQQPSMGCSIKWKS
jgi:peroxiredoxin